LGIDGASRLKGNLKQSLACELNFNKRKKILPNSCDAMRPNVICPTLASCMTSSFMWKGRLMTSVDDTLAPVDDSRDAPSNIGLYVLGGLAMIVALVWVFSISWM
jgi:hypothetical protein